MRLGYITQRVLVFSVAFAASTGRPQLAAAQASTDPASKPPTSLAMHVIPAPIEQMTLVLPGTGWASTGDKILWTKDNGAHWKDISPKNPHHDHPVSAFFLDASSGWVLFAHLVSDEEHESSGVSSDWVFWVASTRDCGASWAQSDASAPLTEAGTELNGVGQIIFSGIDEGWIELHHSSTWGSLLSTIDGGRTWTWIKTAPTLAAEVSVSPTRGVFLAGMDGDGESKLYASFDGGREFSQLTFGSPEGLGGAHEPTYSAPLFFNSSRGFEAVTFSGGKTDPSASVLFVTEDGGRHWTRDRMLTGLHPSSVGQRVSSTVAGSIWILPMSATGDHIRLTHVNSGNNVAAMRPDVGWSDSCKPSFVSPEEGWVKCGGTLSATSDDGRTWVDITPHLRNGAITSAPLSGVPSAIPARVKVLANIGREAKAVLQCTWSHQDRTRVLFA